MKGRKPVPTNLKILRGNPHGHALNKLEPKGETKVPVCPKVIQADPEARLQVGQALQVVFDPRTCTVFE